ncbi:Ubiquitin-conjugating enzyme family protein, putative isoform 1 [Hibiscus syriacus]|uniref:Ubiquitin-conjugating enzyme family protein, putative isoform 1 n=1 Tax=Hibiscus syriacus TaxID=106335 RepID=A0A6A2XR75_HIBSY|nr:major strawberry allergen Fra a 1-E-like [Hibiscus syriacus]KAE8660909.1 Ubiquitin-conjugating enzyme family protein, putative isoform 1 [Hibiscus syriacus]
MKTMKGEVVLNMPAQKAWEMYRNDEIISKINPDLLSRAQYIQGDGGPGSLRLFKLGPAVSNYVKESVEKIEKVVTGRSVTYEVIEGDLKEMYDTYRVTFSFIPIEGNNTKCIAEWKAEFEPSAPAMPPPEKAKDAALRFLKSFDNFQLSY